MQREDSPMHDVIIVGIPLLAILAGILFNRNDFTKLRDDLKSDIKDVRSEMKDFRTEVRARFDMVDAELRYFHGATGKLEGRVDAIEKRN
jgi:hypothetical protein